MSDDLLLTRVHPALTARAEALRVNLLAYHGGRPYIDERLSRFPAESETDFAGDPATKAIGRKDRAFLVNCARRIPQKIAQYVFAQAASREGAAPGFPLGCDGHRHGLASRPVDPFFRLHRV